MIVGTEWLIEAFDCDARALRELGKYRADNNIDATWETRERVLAMIRHLGCVQLDTISVVARSQASVKRRLPLQSDQNAFCSQTTRL